MLWEVCLAETRLLLLSASVYVLLQTLVRPDGVLRVDITVRRGGVRDVNTQLVVKLTAHRVAVRTFESPSVEAFLHGEILFDSQLFCLKAVDGDALLCLQAKLRLLKFRKLALVASVQDLRNGRFFIDLLFLLELLREQVQAGATRGVLGEELEHFCCARQ